MKKILLILTVCSSLSSLGQTKIDTFGIMQYNLLYYRTTTTQCTNTTNNVATKDAAMKTIIDHVQPSILIVNEMAGDGGTASVRLKDNALNQSGRSYYKQCNYSANSNLSNMLYYDSRYFALHSQTKVDRNTNNTFIVRQIDVYRLMYLDQSELDAGDTTFLTFYVAHFKASNTSSDRDERADATEAVMAFHETNYADDNYFMAGDFNVYTSSEAAYQNLIAHSNTNVRFKDPINQAGSWNNNANYADFHTQSTQVSGSCKSGGGLDDRFDFILCGQEVLDNSRNVNYIADTYKAIGNDGDHFNKSITTGANPSVPTAVLLALDDMSDHLPVYMQIGVGRTTAGVRDLAMRSTDWILGNPVQSEFRWKWVGEEKVVKMKIIDPQGKVVVSATGINDKAWNLVDASAWANGIYSASLFFEDGRVIRKKLVKID